jgi:hypothetical protein
LARPYSKRRDEAACLSGRQRQSGEPTPHLPPGVRRTRRSLRRLRIKTQKPLPGMRHPLAARDIHALLEILGPASIYRLKSIRLRQESAVRAEGIVFAEYVAPGEIHLYAVPELPWRLPFLLYAEDREAFARYGARLKTDLEREQTTVTWSVDGLKRFALQEVLAHELGHHLLQHHKGKRTVMLCRRSDHEKRADLQSRRVLQILRRGESHG